MRKTGSTSITRLAGPRAARVKVARDYLRTNIVASVRDPIERFASGYRQVETFYELGWVPGHFFRGQCVLKWTRDDCAGNPKMAAGFRSGKKEPPPPEAAARRKTRQIRRLLRFISDVERCGFFDDHIYPMAPYFAALARAGVALEAITLVKTDDLDLALPQHLRQPRVVPKAMSTAGRSWARSLVAAAADPSDADSALAREAVRRICRLVARGGADVPSTQGSTPPRRHRGDARSRPTPPQAVDYACFSFEPPELCRAALGEAVTREPYPPPVALARPTLPVSRPRVHTCAMHVEDPVARLLRAHQSYDGQYLLGWRDRDVDALNLRFPERHCYVWHQIDDHIDHEMTDLYSFGLAHKLARLEAFVDDVAARGFFDDSLRPQTEHTTVASTEACFAEVRAFCSERRVPVDRGRKQGTEAGGAVCTREFVRVRGGAMGPCTLGMMHEYIYASGDRSRAEPWAVDRAELLAAARGTAAAQRIPAQRILATACALYEASFACFARAGAARVESPGCGRLVRRVVGA